ncbi:MAG: hypothetical protein ACP5OG_03415 [Candidatus Nanoarchaeia archaeon]
MLFYGIDKTNEKVSSISSTKIIHDPKQIMNPSDLIVGRVYKQINKNFGKIAIFKYLGQSEELGWIKVKHLKWPKSIARQEISLADSGIIPYANGVWNNVNYLLVIKQKGNKNE